MTLPDLAVDGVFDAAVSTFDGLNYLTPDELRLTLAAVAGGLRPAGWLVFDLHTDAMMDFTDRQPRRRGRVGGQRLRDQQRRRSRRPHVRHQDRGHPDRATATRSASSTASTSTRTRTSAAALEDAGFAVTAVGEEYTHEPADASTLRATWTARRLST